MGGTHCRLALFEPGAGSPTELEIYASQEHQSLEQMLGTFLAEVSDRPRAASLGVAGPVSGGRSQAVNLPWPVERESLARELGLSQERVWVLNDLVANAWGIEALAPADLATLNEGSPAPGEAAALISAGTGLGQAFISYGPGGPAVHASEGGHVDFAPRSELQGELWRWLRRDHEHVSVELACSGIGLRNLFDFLRSRTGQPEPAWLASESDRGKAIAAAGLARSDATASEALDLMASIYGAQAGNLALTVMARGGVYLGGGIAPHILPRLREGGFMEAFVAKGRFSDLLARIPVRVILNEQTALLGAARHAERRLRELA